MRLELVHERIKNEGEECICDWCMRYLRTGTPVRVSQAFGLIYCSHACAELHGAERKRHGRPALEEAS